MLVGAAIGIAGAVGVTRFMSAMLSAINADDPLTFPPVAFWRTLVALAACYVPALRAIKIDPMTALRQD